VQRPGEFFRALGETVVDEGFDVERVQVVDASTEAIFDYLMKRSSRP
jgi:hypothetical protein